MPRGGARGRRQLAGAEYEEHLPPGEGVSAPDHTEPASSNEERCVWVVSLSSKATNKGMVCKSCGLPFKGGPQKIRVHVTGVREGDTYIRACPRPYREYFEYCLKKQEEKNVRMDSLPPSTAAKRARFQAEDGQAAGAGGGAAGAGGAMGGDAAGGDGGGQNGRMGRAPAEALARGGVPRPAPPVTVVDLASEERPAKAARQAKPGTIQTFIDGATYETKRKFEVDVKVMEFLCEAGLPAYAVEYPSFARIFQAVHEYSLPSRKAYAPPCHKAFGRNGPALVEAERRVDNQRAAELEKIKQFGNTLCADAMTKYKRPSNNTVLVSRRRTLFCAHVEYSGVSKTDIELAMDAERVIKEFGGTDVIFLVCMDGAALGVMNLLEARIPRLLVQRCATHALSLVLGDLSKLFPEVCTFVHDVVAFIFSHNKLYVAVKSFSAKMLVLPAETRMASFALALERICEAKGELRELIAKEDTKGIALSSRARNAAALFNSLETRILNEPATWQRLEKARKILIPVKKVLRITDTASPNLHTVVFGYLAAWGASVRAAGGQGNTLDGVTRAADGGGLAGTVAQVFKSRYNDVCSEAALAAAAVNPYHVLHPVSPFTGARLDSAWMPRDASKSLKSVLKRVLDNNTAAVNTAMEEWRKFVYGDGPFDDEDLRELGKTSEAEAYWQTVKLEEKATTLAPVALKLVTAFSGQGGAERANRDVVLQKGKLQQRQAASTTRARLAVKYALRPPQEPNEAPNLLNILAARISGARVDANVAATAGEDEDESDDAVGGEFGANRWLAGIVNRTDGGEDDDDTAAAGEAPAAGDTAAAGEAPAAGTALAADAGQDTDTEDTEG